MAKSHRSSKRVSWAPDVNLCQVRLFLSEDAPSQSGFGIQDHLQAKTSWLLHSSGMGSDDQPPPGFEGPIPALPQIVLVKWKCPPRLMLNPDWQVVAGEESKEAELQIQRELRVLEAVYPRLSAIPPSPSDSSELHLYHHDDSQTPLIPITPIEDDDAADSLDSVSPIRTLANSQSQCLPKSLTASGTVHLSTTSSSEVKSRGNEPNIPTPNPNERPAIGAIPGVEPDVVAAASAAFTAIMRSNEEGSLIDRDLLIKILSNPKLLEQLVLDHGMLANQQFAPKPSSTCITASLPMPLHANTMGSEAPLSIPLSGQFNPRANTTLPTLNPPIPPIPNLRPAPNAVQNQIASTVPMKTPPVKDINYYKSLIQQHGGERNEAQDQTLVRFSNHHNQNPFGANPEPIESSKPRELKPKMQRPCVYFNSPTGCRHGANCMFQHDVSYQKRIGGMPEVQGGAKRMKLERELTGRS